MTSQPFPIRRSASSTIGLSRRSSVPDLNARPKIAILRLPNSRMLSTARRTCISLDTNTFARTGSSRSCFRAVWSSARTSVGKHEPPKAKPGRRYAPLMFNLVSVRKMSMTSCESSPSVAHSVPISLPKVTFSAWKLLSTYFVISATAIGTRKRGPSRPSYRLITADPLRSSLSPTTVFGGFSKSQTLEPSLRNSGLTHTPKSTQARLPDACSSTGMRTFSHVPGTIVLRNTTTCQPSLPASASPISSLTVSRYRVDNPPPDAEGVPTQTIEMSEPRTASAGSAVTVSLPAATTLAVSSPIRSSTTGDWPRRTNSILSRLASTPITAWPRAARHAADTQPTYPRPKTLTVSRLACLGASSPRVDVTM